MSRSSEFAVRTSYMLLAALLIYSSSVGCEKPIWENSLDSPGQLGLAVVDALNRKDIEHLNRLRVEREEFLDWIWPEFPASRPPSNFPGDFAWSNMNKKCNIGMKKWISRYGGHNLKFVSIRFERPQETYDGFQLLRGTILTLQNAAGEKRDLKILGSVVVKNNRYKLLSYED
ncbi:hypothetical protein F4009_15950 [Candidatus Poribacteria bacterium]|nr:hypothetical protein [Candidatus Poribacteria bacterium]MYH81533.1 hypothetical protein [Candidatus Poribacteria bacterium]MYK95467.1 hypothetical protein [Candidatus Poribacteria bacterium]